MNDGPGREAPILKRGLVSARAAAMGGAAVACGACAFGGFYLQFDEGAARWLLGLAAAAFAPLVTSWALAARGRDAPLFASLRVGLAACAAGWAAAVIGGAATMGADAILGVAGFALVFGTATGASYAVPLMILVANVREDVAAERPSADGDDRAHRFVGCWAAFGGAVAIFASRASSHVTWTIASEVVGAALLVSGIVIAVRATVRIGRRRRFLAEVDRGNVPAFALRPAAQGEDVQHLPRLGDGKGERVLVWNEPHARGDAYRVPAAGRAVARA